MKYISIIFLTLIVSLGLSSCKDQSEIDLDKIQAYLDDHNLTAEKTEEGLYYIIEKEGSGPHPTVNNEVTVHYEGKTLDEKVFDSSFDRNEPATFPLSQVIEGWQIGIPLFKEGGEGWLFIPSDLAYGANPPYGSSIGKNEVLIFKVVLLDVI